MRSNKPFNIFNLTRCIIPRSLVTGSGVYFSNMLTAKANSNASVFLSFVFMLVQAGLLYALTWYLSLVAPGQYGQALPWNFLFKVRPISESEVKWRERLEECVFCYRIQEQNLFKDTLSGVCGTSCVVVSTRDECAARETIVNCTRLLHSSVVSAPLHNTTKMFCKTWFHFFKWHKTHDGTFTFKYKKIVLRI